MAGIRTVDSIRYAKVRKELVEEISSRAKPHEPIGDLLETTRREKYLMWDRQAYAVEEARRILSDVPLTTTELQYYYGELNAKLELFHDEIVKMMKQYSFTAKKNFDAE